MEENRIEENNPWWRAVEFPHGTDIISKVLRVKNRFFLSFKHGGPVPRRTIFNEIWNQDLQVITFATTTFMYQMRALCRRGNSRDDWAYVLSPTIGQKVVTGFTNRNKFNITSEARNIQHITIISSQTVSTFVKVVRARVYTARQTTKPGLRPSPSFPEKAGTDRVSTSRQTETVT